MDSGVDSGVDSGDLMIDRLDISTVSLLIFADPQAIWVRQLQGDGFRWGVTVTLVSTLEEFWTTLGQTRYEALLLDLDALQAMAIDGLTVLAELQFRVPHSLVLVVSHQTSLLVRATATRLGCCCYLSHPVTAPMMFAALAQALKQAQPVTAHLLLVGQANHWLERLVTLLATPAYRVTVLHQPHRCLEALAQNTPDLLILETELQFRGQPTEGIMPNALPMLSSVDLCRVIRADPHWYPLPLVCVSRANLPLPSALDSHCLAVGADDVLSLAMSQSDFQVRLRTRLLQRQRQTQLETDDLTGVNLRQKTIQEITRFLQLARRQHHPFCLAMIDLDWFKQVNDCYGHETGDFVLRQMGHLLSQVFRNEDVVGRWGGEEFMIGMYGISRENGIKRLQQVAQQLRQHPFYSSADQPFHITFSAGISQFPEDGNDFQSLYRAADLALYQAKVQGRQQIIVAT